MRLLVVVALQKSIEASLLLQEIRRSGLGGLAFQGQMHALMPAVLFRMPRLDAFDLNSEAQPPDRQPTQPVQRVR